MADQLISGSISDFASVASFGDLGLLALLFFGVRRERHVRDRLQRRHGGNMRASMPL
jgi:hypothetical protein